jgi:LAO/AO transport system kinase
MGSTQKKKLTPSQHVEGVRKGHRASIAQTITLIESSAAKHFEDAQSVLEQLMPYTGSIIECEQGQHSWRQNKNGQALKAS